MPRELINLDMYCPQCGSAQADDLNFCKSCGAHLQAVRTALETRETGEKFDALIEPFRLAVPKLLN